MIVERNMKIMKITIPYLRKYVTGRDIILVGKKLLEEECQRSFPDCRFIDEDNLYTDLNYHTVKSLVSRKNKYATWRTGWYFQQFLKMAYAMECKESYYLVWDTDTVPLRPISMINSSNEKPYFDVKTEYNRPYFTTLKKLFFPPIEKKVPYSYISEHMLINTDIMKHLVKDIESNHKLNGELFFEKILNAILEIDILHSGFSEFETYGNYVNIKYKDFYDIRQLKSLRNGKYYLGNDLYDDLLEWAAASYDLISIEESSETNTQMVHKISKLMARMSLEDIVKEWESK